MASNEASRKWFSTLKVELINLVSEGLYPRWKVRVVLKRPDAPYRWSIQLCEDEVVVDTMTVVLSDFVPEHVKKFIEWFGGGCLQEEFEVREREVGYSRAHEELEHLSEALFWGSFGEPKSIRWGAVKAAVKAGLLEETADWLKEWEVRQSVHVHMLRSRGGGFGGIDVVESKDRTEWAVSSEAVGANLLHLRVCLSPSGRLTITAEKAYGRWKQASAHIEGTWSVAEGVARLRNWISEVQQEWTREELLC